jgi:2-methylisocitrate lyase-like PEP mutase family enzyme
LFTSGADKAYRGETDEAALRSPTTELKNKGGTMTAMTSAQKRHEFRRALSAGPINIAPGAADVLTARLIAHMGYPAVYLSGSLQHAVRGYADVNALTMSEMVQTTHTVAHEISIPCLADAETGFGHGINVVRAVREFERSGVAAIHLEDSTVPKRPARLGFESPTVSKGEFLDKIKAALDARTDELFVIVARSELRGDFAGKVERLHGALELGADAFWAGGFSSAEIETVCRQLNKPALAVLPKGVHAEQFGAWGVKMAVVPNALALAGLIAQRELLAQMKGSGSWSEWLERQPGFEEADAFYAAQAAVTGTEAQR